MRVRISNTISKERTLNGGSSQGAKLGVILFAIGVDDIPEQFPEDVLKVRFVDDLNAVEGVEIGEEDWDNVQEKYIVKPKMSQEVFEQMVNRSKERNMLLNPKKTQALAVHRLNKEKIEVQLQIPGTRDWLQTGLKEVRILGFIMGDEARKPEAHVKCVEKKCASRYWILGQLKRSGVSEQAMVRVYVAMIRSIAEYASPVFHSALNSDQATRIERVQKKALRLIFGWELSYWKALEKAGLERLDYRRDRALLRVGKKMASDPRFERLFPRKEEREGINTRSVGDLCEERWTYVAQFRSPIYAMRRAINSGRMPGNLPGICYAN